ncbi:hypothetical protein EFE20_05030 [Latilactobacillus curvatus]|nr:hypothetical protein [Latilactobacillus curvatus]MCS8606152.1 hypothetical protein [Latilactobacillus curvatus]
MEGKRGSECLLKSVSNIDFNPINGQDYTDAINRSESMLVFPDKKGIQVVGNKIIVKVNG